VLPTNGAMRSAVRSGGVRVRVSPRTVVVAMAAEKGWSD
jgi:hypothetical protein